jgi:nucleoside-diphosphate-sugar epimerase
VGDVVRANMFAMMNHEATGVFNIGAGRNYSINDLADIVLERHLFGSNGDPDIVSGKSSREIKQVRLERLIKNVELIPPRLGEANITLADVSKAADVLGWRPTVSLEQGLDVLDAYEKKMGVGSSGIILVSK